MEAFSRNWPFVRGIHRSPVNSPHKGQWRWALMFSLIYVWMNDWVNNREAGDLRRYRAHYDFIVMNWKYVVILWCEAEGICSLMKMLLVCGAFISNLISLVISRSTIYLVIIYHDPSGLFQWRWDSDMLQCQRSNPEEYVRSHTWKKRAGSLSVRVSEPARDRSWKQDFLSNRKVFGAYAGQPYLALAKHSGSDFTAWSEVTACEISAKFR